MKRKALRFEVSQPTAHYRDPKVFQNDYIATLNLPIKTTIIGMITYICDRRLKSNIDIGVIGNYGYKELEFSRGERLEFWEDYRKLKKGKDQEKFLKTGEYYDYYKNFVCENSILNYEVLKNVKLSIFFTCDDEYEFEMVKDALNNPGKYMNLGRKEDFVVPVRKGIFAEEVELDEVMVTNFRDAIEKGIKLLNSYVKVDLTDSRYDNIMKQGALCALPSSYKDITASKNDRVVEFSHYIYIGKDGIYPTNVKVNVCEQNNKKEVFAWL